MLRLEPTTDSSKGFCGLCGYGQLGTPHGQIAGSLPVSDQQLIPQVGHLPDGSSLRKSSLAMILSPLFVILNNLTALIRQPLKML
jgi:hypothetical protein